MGMEWYHTITRPVTPSQIGQKAAKGLCLEASSEILNPSEGRGKSMYIFILAVQHRGEKAGLPTDYAMKRK